MQIYTVGAVTRYLKQVIESDPQLQDIWIEGEISNWRVSAAGHAYFTLKDASCQLSCVCFRTRLASMRFAPGNGDAVIAHGRVSLYEPQGSYQLTVDLLQPEGIGKLHLQFELLRSQLEREGLFDTSRKRPLPRFPQRIGVVTSATGAVWHDILTVLGRRYPLAEVVLAPTLVQGGDAVPQICRAIEALNEWDGIDVIIVARGGGSLEELWPFNEERVARTIFASRVPVVSAIGHETDYTIADYVADVRAPTPSAAAEIVAPDWRACRAQVEALQDKMADLIAYRCDEARGAVGRASQILLRFSPRSVLDLRRQQTDDLDRRMREQLVHGLSLYRGKLEARALQLATLDPLAVLARGYSICRFDDQIVSRVAQVEPGDHVTVQVSDGEFHTLVD